jgi:hypothetical protein
MNGLQIIQVHSDIHERGGEGRVTLSLDLSDKLK